MIGAWLAQTPVVLCAAAIVFGPGLAIGWLLRLRGLFLWALAPVGSTAVLAGLAVLYGAVGVRWSVVSAAVGCLVIAALAAAGGVLAVRGDVRPAVRHRRWRWPLAAGIAVGAASIVAPFVVYVDAPGAISQTNDAVFHLNVLRYILSTGDASSLHVSGVLGAHTFYPAAWHALASLLTLTTGCSIPVAANVVTLAIVAGVWPVGIAWLTREATGRSGSADAVAAALSGAMWAFPMLLVQWGVLYPYGLSVALLPASLALVVAVPRWMRVRGPAAGRTGNVVIIVVLLSATAAALILAQPASLLTWALLAVVFVTWRVILRPHPARRAARVRAIVAVAALWCVLAVLWGIFARETSGAHWPPSRGRLHAVLDVIVNSQLRMPAAAGVSILMVIGLVIAVRRRRLRWLATAWVALSVLYVLGAGAGREWIRDGVLGAWYSDPYRFAALAPLAVISLAAIGLTHVSHWATVAISGRRWRTAARFAGAWCLVGVAGLAAIAFAVHPVTQMPQPGSDIAMTQSLYTTSEFLSADARRVLEQLDRSTPADARIIGNPSTGVGFGYMLSGRDVYPRTWQPPGTAAWNTLAQSLRDVATDPAVCPALKAFGSPGYVLDFGLGRWLPGRWEMPGMTDLAGRGGFALVDRVGSASLWRITACGRG